MNDKARGAFVILGSIIISSVLTYLLTKAKYEKRIYPQPDISEETKPKTKQNTLKNGEEIALQNTNQKIDVTKYAEKYIRHNSELVRDYTSDPEPETDTIEIIDEDIFDSNASYEGITFTLYSDGVLADELNHIVSDPENSIGRFTVERFDELEHNGAVYVRNHETKTDFEILRDLRSYDEAVGGSHAQRS